MHSHFRVVTIQTDKYKIHIVFWVTSQFRVDTDILILRIRIIKIQRLFKAQTIMESGVAYYDWRKIADDCMILVVLITEIKRLFLLH